MVTVTSERQKLFLNSRLLFINSNHPRRN